MSVLYYYIYLHTPIASCCDSLTHFSRVLRFYSVSCVEAAKICKEVVKHVGSQATPLFHTS